MGSSWGKVMGRFALVLVAFGAACGTSSKPGGGPVTACYGGDIRDCFGQGNCRGIQRCPSDGSGWTACDCSAGTGGGPGTDGGAGKSAPDGATDGSSGAGGSAGSPGDSGTGGGAGAAADAASGGGGFGTGGFGTGGFGGAGGTVLFAFPFSLQGFTSLPNTTGDPSVLSTQSTVSFDGAVGSPSPGSVRLVIPFSADAQQADFYGVTGTLNLTGKTLYANVRLDSGFGLDTFYPGGVILFAFTTPSMYLGQSYWQDLPPSWMGTWHEFTFDLSSPDLADAYYDPSQVMAVGIAFMTGSINSVPASIHVDTIGYR
jgi:hypothetical protein